MTILTSRITPLLLSAPFTCVWVSLHPPLVLFVCPWPPICGTCTYSKHAPTRASLCIVPGKYESNRFHDCVTVPWMSFSVCGTWGSLAMRTFTSAMRSCSRNVALWFEGTCVFFIFFHDLLQDSYLTWWWYQMPFLCIHDVVQWMSSSVQRHKWLGWV